LNRNTRTVEVGRLSSSGVQETPAEGSGPTAEGTTSGCSPGGLSRRAFLSGVAVALAGCASATATEAGILDTHTHFYDPTRPGGVDWPPANDPLLHRPILPAEFETLARPLGITGTVIVEASPRESDNDWVLDLFPRTPFLRGLVGHLKPGEPGFSGHLDRLKRRPAFRGIRTGGWDGPLDAAKPGFLHDCERLAEAGLVLEVLIGTDRLEQVDRIARQLPGLQIVLDHCANVRIDGQAPPTAWLAGMDRCAGHAAVHCKFSGLVEGSGRTDGTAPADPQFYAPVLDALWQRFGPRRLIFGSNWPVSARFAPLDRVVGIAREYLSHRDPVDARHCLRINAERIYRIPTKA
jgi:predicted TIM-barrel fold metal-dependent hydrolase